MPEVTREETSKVALSQEVPERIPLERIEDHHTDSLFKPNLLSFISPHHGCGKLENGLSPFELVSSTKGCESFPKFVGTFEGYMELTNLHSRHPEASPKLPRAIFRLDNHD
eukprot:TRINITY_DN3065_c0_g4_i1.p3 TRINITY_DN3065_c0_g4~~TRINITY_DN3065_c0_g4_i1.p3  ORF type:complete len:111 (+),score=11.79 TRINITY_DN3065_c0_g4_i1:1023-1355(+)